jgi:putative ABC transport system permease protein
MPLLARVASAVRSCRRKDRWERELSEEIDSYLEMLVQEKIRAGMNPEQARRCARIEMGGEEQVKEGCRDTRPTQWMEDLFRDLRYALRMLRKSHGFTVVVVLTLALGIGANTAMFTVVQSVLLKPLPYPEDSRLVQFCQRFGKDTVLSENFSAEDFKDYQAQATAFEHLACLDKFTEVNFNLTGTSGTRRVVAMPVSAHFFELLGSSACLGRTFTEAEERVNAGVAVLTHRLWQEHFHGERRAVGRNLILDGRPFVVIGVMPASFPNLVEGDVDLWTPQDLQPGERNYRGNDYLSVLGRVKKGITSEQAQAQLDVISANLAEQYPGTNKGRSAHLVPLRDRIVGNARPMLYVLMAAVGLVLLIACVNVANLFLIRGASRAREFTLRCTLGAPRLRTVRQLLTESFAVAVLGGGVGLSFASVVVKVLLFFMPEALPPVDVVFLDSSVFLFCTGLISFTGFLFGLIPVRQSSRWSPEQVLRSAGRSAGSGSRQSRTRNLLVASQISLALCLLVGTALLYASFGNLLKVDLGFQPRGVTTFQIHLPDSRYATPEALINFHRTLSEKIEAVPGVRAAGCVSKLPASGPYNTWGFTIEGRPRNGPGEPRPDADFRGVEGSYFQSLNIAVREGRLFDRHDNATTTPVALVSETFSRKYWPGTSPLGKQFTAAGKMWTVIGVVQDTRIDLRQPASPTAYLSFSQFPRRRWAMTYAVRWDFEGADLMERVRQVLSAIDPDLIPYNVRSLSDVVTVGIARTNFALWLMGAFAALALALAGIGIYGVVSYSVTSRVHEIGIRMAVGAGQSEVLTLFLLHGFKLALIGAGIGSLVACASTKALSGMLFGISTTDPLAFAGAGVCLMAVALLACWIPARRAARVDPQVALRQD